MAVAKAKSHWRRESVDEATSHVLEESRMVLPGIQALFGFQLMVVFNEPFTKLLSEAEQGVHLAALAATALAVLVVMAPAAYHRQAEPERTSRTFVRFASVCLTAGMLALAVGTSLDFYLVTAVVLGRGPATLVAASALFAGFVALWFVLPRLRPPAP
jgi:uncharacterized protein DUF6328